MKILSFLIPILSLGLLLGSCETYENAIPDPQVQTLSSDQAELIEAFSGLTGGDESACNFIYETESIPDVLCRIVAEAEPGSEIVFLVDKTSSMDDDIDAVRSNINQIIDCLPPQTFLGAAAYGDRLVDGSGWFERTELTSDFATIRQFIDEINPRGGGDTPESVYDAIWLTLDQMPWQNCEAPDKIIVMGDAVPHTGSKTNYSLEDVLDKARSICTDTEFYPVIVLNL